MYISRINIYLRSYIYVCSFLLTCPSEEDFDRCHQFFRRTRTPLWERLSSNCSSLTNPWAKGNARCALYKQKRWIFVKNRSIRKNFESTYWNPSNDAARITPSKRARLDSASSTSLPPSVFSSFEPSGKRDAAGISSSPRFSNPQTVVPLRDSEFLRPPPDLCRRRFRSWLIYRSSLPLPRFRGSARTR